MSCARNRGLRGFVAVAFLFPAVASAQAIGTLPRQPVAPVARPEFKSLRFDEAWTVANRSGAWDDELKAIPLASHLTLTIGGQARWREEFAHSYNLTGVSDNYGQSRLLLNADLHAGNARRLHARAYLELRDAQSYDRDLPGGTRPTDADRADVQNAFADLAWNRSYVRIGRQEIVSNRERLIGVPDWANTRRQLQGVRTMFVRGAFAVEAMSVRPVQVRLAAANRADTSARFRVLSVGSAPGAKKAALLLPSAWQAYWYEQKISASMPTRRLTSGGRLAWTFAGAETSRRSYGFETEAAVQRGNTGARAIRAWYLTTELQAQLRHVHGAPTFALGLEAASGDRSSSDNTLGAFNTLYAAAHAHGGFADVFGRANARQVQIISTWDPIRRVNLRGSWHHYDRLRLDDGAYSKQNTIMRAASGSRARHVGDEFNLTGNLNVNRHLRMIAGHAWVLPGAFMMQTADGALQERWSFIGTAFTF